MTTSCRSRANPGRAAFGTASIMLIGCGQCLGDVLVGLGHVSGGIRVARPLHRACRRAPSDPETKRQSLVRVYEVHHVRPTLTSLPSAPAPSRPRRATRGGLRPVLTGPSLDGAAAGRSGRRDGRGSRPDKGISHRRRASCGPESDPNFHVQRRRGLFLRADGVTPCTDRYPCVTQKRKRRPGGRRRET